MRIGVVGGGVVGSATARSFIEHVDEVRVYDVVVERRTHDFNEVLKCDIVFVCLPTPQKADELCCDTKYLDEFFANVPRNVNYVIRSTVPVGYTRSLNLPNVVHSPEFLTARCAFVDAQMPARNVIGYPTGDTRTHNLLAQLYCKRFPHVHLYQMSSDASELLKLAQNAFFATKVAFFNELYSLCESKGIAYDCLREALLADGRISPSHTLVPGPDGLRGFGGTCLPKDLASYISHFDGIPAWVAMGAMHRNQEDRP